jgi:hypothetical protein
MPIADRPAFFISLFAKLLQMRIKLGRPHWLLLDEAHHLMPSEWETPHGILPEELLNVLMITVHPELLGTELLERIDTVLAVGPTASEMLNKFTRAAGLSDARAPVELPRNGEFLMWLRGSTEVPRRIIPHPCRTERQRHRRKYAEGALPPERSFFFRGPHGKLKLRAQNVMLFLQMSDGVDDETWEFHARQGDYSAWFRNCIKDEQMARAIEQIEKLEDISADEGRELLRATVEREYTLPATGALPVPGAS